MFPPKRQDKTRQDKTRQDNELRSYLNSADKVQRILEKRAQTKMDSYADNAAAEDELRAAKELRDFVAEKKVERFIPKKLDSISRNAKRKGGCFGSCSGRRR